MAPKIFSTLSSIQNLAGHLSERHLLQQYKSKEHGLALTKLIDSAFRDLHQCVKILNTCAPISQLPTDILGLVFDTVREEDYIRPSTKLSTPTGPLTNIPALVRLSQVSQSWRNVTASLPLLWTLVRVSSPWRFQLIKGFLSKSKSLPIQLSIIDMEDSFEEDEDLATGEEHAMLLCDILAPHIHRCRSISVISDGSAWPLLMVMQNRFQDLDAQFLEQAMLICEDFDLEYEPQHLFRSAPLLAVLRLNVHALTICYPPLDHPVSLHLTLTGAFSIMGLTPFELFDNLSQCQVLEHLYLYGDVADDDDYDDIDDEETGIYTLSALRTIHFYGNTMETRNLIWGHILAPLLDLMLIAPFGSDFYMENLPDLSQEGPQQFPALKTLSLAVDSDSSEWSLNVDTYFPMVENLVLGGDGGLVPGSLTRDQYHTRLPHLRTLSLRNMSFGESEDELCEFITRRKAANMMLPNILLDSASLVNMRRLDWLETQVEVTVRDPWLDQDGRLGSVAIDSLELRI